MSPFFFTLSLADITNQFPSSPTQPGPSLRILSTLPCKYLQTMKWNHFANLVLESGALQQRLKYSILSTSKKLNKGKLANHTFENYLIISANLLLFNEK